RHVDNTDVVGVLVLVDPLQGFHHVRGTADTNEVAHFDVDQVDFRSHAHILARRKCPVAADDAGHVAAVPKVVIGGTANIVREVSPGQNAAGDPVGLLEIVPAHDAAIHDRNCDALSLKVGTFIPDAIGPDAANVGADQARGI